MTNPTTSQGAETAEARVREFAQHASERHALHGSLIFCSGKTLRPADLAALLAEIEALKGERERPKLTDQELSALVRGATYITDDSEEWEGPRPRIAISGLGLRALREALNV